MTTNNTQSPLSKLIAADKKARNFGFEWENYNQIIKQIQSETAEVQEALDNQESQERIQEELGDLVHATLCLAFFMNYDVNHILEKTTEKFAHRFEILQKIALKNGYTTLQGQPTELLLQFWKEAKKESYL
jgi:uncharacterized protein YabN with tetrapyrrole methylase and pyrophosphatase domain